MSGAVNTTCGADRVANGTNDGVILGDVGTADGDPIVVPAGSE